MELFEGHPDDLHTCLWHLGRMRIKDGDEKGIEDIEKHMADTDDWHWKANDHALLGIAYFDIKNDREQARQHLFSMMQQYPKEGDVLDCQAIKKHTYAVDNALANVIAAIERFCRDDTLKAVLLCSKLTSLQEELKKLRSESIKSLPF